MEDQENNLTDTTASAENLIAQADALLEQYGMDENGSEKTQTPEEISEYDSIKTPDENQSHSESPVKPSQKNSDSAEEKKRRLILKIVDPREIGESEYPYFVNYAIANIYTALTKNFSVRMPSKEEVHIMALDAIALAFNTHDMQKAQDSGAAFVTHLGWKCKQVAKTYVREVAKANRNTLNTSDEELHDARVTSSNMSDSEGNITHHNETDTPELHQSSKAMMNESRKIEYAMRHVRWELPRESNVILDIGLGEKTKMNGSNFTFVEWAEYTNQDVEHVRKLFRKAKAIIKRKLIRKGFYAVIIDEEKGLEDFEKETRVKEEIDNRETSESIIPAADTIEAETTEVEESGVHEGDLMKNDMRFVLRQSQTEPFEENFKPNLTEGIPHG